MLLSHSGVQRRYDLEEVCTSSAMLLSHESASVAAAREHVSADLAAQGVDPQRIEDTSLVVSELVGNAVRHARPLPRGHLQLSWLLDDGTIEIAVSDGGSASVPTEGPLSHSAAGGRGLGIVAHVAEAWGIRREDDDVTTVWAVVPAPVFANSK